MGTHLFGSPLYLRKSEIDLNQAGVLVQELIKRLKSTDLMKLSMFFLKLQVLCALKVRKNQSLVCVGAKAEKENRKNN